MKNQSLEKNNSRVNECILNDVCHEKTDLNDTSNNVQYSALNDVTLIALHRSTRKLSLMFTLT